MSLKLLIFPAFIILSLILAIGYIKPEIDTILSKREEIAAQKEALQKVDTVAANIQSLSQSVKNRRETESFVLKYYPRSLDQERIVDALNYLAQQSGVIVTGVDLVEDPVAHLANTGDLVNPDGTPFDAATIESLEAALPHTFTAQATVFGAYPNLKDFFEWVYRVDRVHTTNVFSITRRESGAGNSEEDAARGIQENFLVATLEAQFSYVVEKKSGNALSQALFQDSTFDYSTADRLINFVTSPLPVLETDPLGRSNPFE